MIRTINVSDVPPTATRATAVLSGVQKCAGWSPISPSRGSVFGEVRLDPPPPRLGNSSLVFRHEGTATPPAECRIFRVAEILVPGLVYEDQERTHRQLQHVRHVIP